MNEKIAKELIYDEGWPLLDDFLRTMGM